MTLSIVPRKTILVEGDLPASGSGITVRAFGGEYEAMLISCGGEYQMFLISISGCCVLSYKM